jgi:hypothetical protein
MIVAGDATTSAYGSVRKATGSSPLMVLASLPRKNSPSEKTIPVTIFAMEKHQKM